MARILIADENPEFRSVLRDILEPIGHSTHEAVDAKKAVSCACSLAYQLIILSLSLPKQGGMRALRAIADECPDIPVIVTVDSESAEAAVKAMKLGACHYITKPVNPEELQIITGRALDQKSMLDRNRMLLEELRKTYGFANLVGSSSAAKTAHFLAQEAARTDSAVTIIGGPGTGKDYLARAIHYESERAGSPFIKVSCGTADSTTLECDLFGHEKCALGDGGRRAGLLEQAHGGAVLLEGIEALSPDLRNRILDAVQTRQLERSGGTERFACDVRLIASTGSAQAIDGLDSITIELPPLSERRDDIPPLVHHFIQKYARETCKPVSSISEPAMACVLLCEWPGNIRELENCIERGVIMCGGECVQPTHLTLSGSSQSALSGRKQQHRVKSLRDIERDHIKKILIHCNWNRSTAASILEIDRKTLRSKIREFGFIPPPEE